MYYLHMSKLIEINIPTEMALKAQTVAQNKGMSVDGLYKMYIEKGLQREKRKREDFDRLAELGFTEGPKDLSEKHTEYMID